MTCFIPRQHVKLQPSIFSDSRGWEFLRVGGVLSHFTVNSHQSVDQIESPLKGHQRDAQTTVKLSPKCHV